MNLINQNGLAGIVEVLVVIEKIDSCIGSQQKNKI
jgi:hypothetical protein